MAAYDYVAIDLKGKQKKGSIEGDTPKHVRQLLREKGLNALKVEPVIERGIKGATKSTGSRLRIKVPELALITRQLATLAGSGLPLEQALKAVAEQCEKPKIRSMLLAVRAKVTEGYTLADSLGEFPNVFDNLFRSMVAAGEKSGHLDPVLERLADYAEKRQHIRQKIQMAAMYPSLLLLIAIGVVAALMSYVVPKVVEQFSSAGQSLPELTQTLIVMSDAVRNHGATVFVGSVLGLFLFGLAMRKPAFKKRMHKIQINLPIIGKVTRSLNTARFARTLSILAASGVPLLEGMKIAGNVLSNVVLKEAVGEAAIKVSEGASLSRALKDSGYFPPMMMHMISSGEASGALESMLNRSADNQENEFESMVSVTLGLFEPIIIVVLGAVVLFIVAAILLPIFEMNSLVT